MKAFRVLGCALALTLVVGCGDDDDTPTTDAGRDSGGRDSGECVSAARENTVALCTDGCDNDGNGFTDCEDLACERVRPCCEERGTCPSEACTPEAVGPENTAERCSDGCDNDSDGFTDCEDLKCRAFCGVERSNPMCANGVDDDNNRFTDCIDRQCLDARMTPAIGLEVCLSERNNAHCSDGIDNDGDDLVDCDDPDCQGDGIVVCDGATPVDVEPSALAGAIAARCSDGVDNSGNGFADCGDFTCIYFHAACREAGYEAHNEACSDGIDNDLDGRTDCEDPACDPRRNESIVVCVVVDGAVVVNAALVAEGAEAIREAANVRCSDGMNNDSASSRMDIDCADDSCRRDATVTVCDATTEGNVRTCADGMDNDGNSFADCADFACSRNPDPAVCPQLEKTEAACSDGEDNDENGFADCNDFSCRNRVVCRGFYMCAPGATGCPGRTDCRCP